MKLHKLQKAFAMLNMQFRPLWDKVDSIGWGNMNTRDKKRYSLLSHRIRKLDRKINILVRDYYKLVY